jgi:serine protease AprX
MRRKARNVIRLALTSAAAVVFVDTGIAAAQPHARPDANVGGRSASLDRPGPLHADRDGDGVFDDLAAQTTGKPDDHEFRVIVRLERPATAQRVRRLKREVGSFEVKDRFRIVEAFAGTLEKRQIRTLARSPEVIHIEPDLRVHALNDSAQASFGVADVRAAAPGIDGDADGDVGAYSGDDLVAGVIDTGIDAGHRDLDEGKVIAFKDFVNERADPYDDDGHGTHVAATLAGDGDARADHRYAGVAPAAALVGVKVLDENGSGFTSDVVAGIDWTVAHKADYGIEAINLSLGSSGCSDGTSSDAVAVDNAHDAGLVPAVAAGNDGPGTCTIGSPAAARKALTVAAMADMGPGGFFQAFFSSRGPTADGRIKPDLSAPGVDVTSADAGTSTGYVAFDGTSMATPFAAGVALLMLDANSGLSPQQIKDAMTGTAVDWARGGDNKAAATTGMDIDYGAGRIDAYAAIRSTGAGISSPPPVPAHGLREGSLSGSGDQMDFPIEVIDTEFPIAATMIMSDVDRGSTRNPDFDLYLLDPDGNQVARSEFLTRQEEVGFTPLEPGTYTVRVRSFRGSGPFFVDISAGVGSTATVEGDAVKFSAAEATNNNVAVSEDGGEYTIVDPATPIQPLAGCVAITDHEVRCSGAGVTRAEVDAGDRDDAVTVNGSPPVTMLGGPGEDHLMGGSGDDFAEGGPGNDDLKGRGGDDRLLGGEGDDTLAGHPGGDMLEGEAGSDELYGGLDNDAVDGGSGDDLLGGHDGDDLLNGGNGADLFFGAAGSDAIDARDGVGDVRISCGPESDTVTVDPLDPVDGDCESVSTS